MAVGVVEAALLHDVVVALRGVGDEQKPAVLGAEKR